AIELRDTYVIIYAALGVTPHDASAAGEESFKKLTERAGHKKVSAIGETGLDYHYEHSPRDVQKAVFARHIQLARELNLPLIIHSREAQDDTLDILRDEGVADIGGVMHCFSGSYDMGG